MALLDDDEIDPALRAMAPWEKAYHEANERRFELARQVGYLTGCIKEIARYLEYSDPKIAGKFTALLGHVQQYIEDMEKPNG